MTFASYNSTPYADSVYFDEATIGSIFPDFSDTTLSFDNDFYLRPEPSGCATVEKLLPVSNTLPESTGQGYASLPSFYPTPVETPATHFENTPLTEPDSDLFLIDQLIGFADTSLDNYTTPALPDYPVNDQDFLFGDITLFDNPVGSLQQPISDPFFLPLTDIEANSATPSATTENDPNTVTLSADLFAALVKIAAQNPSVVNHFQQATTTCANVPAAVASDQVSLNTTEKQRKRAAKTYLCSFDNCGRQFSRRFNLEVHQKIHDSVRERPFICQTCQRAFLKSSDLQRHGSVHDESKQHRCPGQLCGKNFSRQDALRRHMKTSGCRDPLVAI